MMFEEITLQQSEAAVLDLFGRFSEEVEERMNFKATPADLLD
jgi:hypothetical protein